MSLKKKSKKIIDLKSEKRYNGLLSIKSVSTNNLIDGFEIIPGISKEKKSHDDMFESEIQKKIIKELNEIGTSGAYSDDDICGPPELNDVDDYTESNTNNDSESLTVTLTKSKPNIKINSNDLNAIFLHFEQKKDILTRQTFVAKISKKQKMEKIEQQNRIRRTYANEGTNDFKWLITQC